MLAIVGRKHHGKTTLVVQLAAELKRRGRRVMTIKHGSHTFNLDPAGTDTYRHYHEGEAERVVMISPDKLALVQRWSEELSPEEVTDRYLADADIVLCEGFKATSLPRIEIFRRAAGERPLFAPPSQVAAHYLAMLTDDDTLTYGGLTMFRLSSPTWLDALASFVEREVLS